MKQSLVQNAFWLQRYINLLISQHFHRKNLKNRRDLTVTVNRERVNSIPIEEAKVLSPY